MANFNYYCDVFTQTVIISGMKKKNILLISANQFTIPYPVYPIGLSYISSYLKSRLPEYDIRIFDLVLNNINELIEYLKDFNPGFIGVSLRNIDDVNIYNNVKGDKKILQKIFLNIYANPVENKNIYSV